MEWWKIVIGSLLILIGVLEFFYVYKQRESGKKSITQIRLLVIGIGLIVCGLIFIFS